MKYLVTGGAGFIGSHIVEELVKHHDVFVMDDFSTGKLENIKNFLHESHIYHKDLSILSDCLEATIGIDIVFHLGAVKSILESFDNPQLYNKINIQGTQNLLQACVENKVKLVVFSSSCAVYGDTDIFPTKEISIPCPTSPYAITKLVGEYYCKVYSLQYNLPTVVLRYFNVFGERQDVDDNYSAVIPKFINCVIQKQPLPIYGDGNQSRDFIYVKNVVDANIKASKILGWRGESLNIAHGNAFSIIKLAQIITDITRVEKNFVFLPSRKGEIYKSEADITLAKEKLEYKLQYNLITGLERTIKYFTLLGNK